MKAPRRLNGSRIAVGMASVGLTVGAFSLYSHRRYGRSAAASLAEYGTRPIKTLAARLPATARVGALAVPRTTAPRIAVLEPVVYNAGARAENARVVSGGILWLGQATWVGQAAQRNGDVDVDTDAFWQRKVTGG